MSKPTDKDWDLEITPESSLFDLKLRDTWHYRDLLLLLVRRDFVSFYKQTVLGPLWFFIQPLATIVLFNFVFANIAKISTGTIPAPIFYLAGTIIWNYFSDCLTKTSTVFKDNSAMLGKVYFPRLIMPLSIVLSNDGHLQYARVSHPSQRLPASIPVVDLVDRCIGFGFRYDDIRRHH